MERENAWKKYTESDVAKLEKLAAGYIDFISENKTERECCTTAIKMARKAGYISLAEAQSRGSKLRPGDRVYAHNCGKSLMLVQVGKLSMQRGFNILGAHIDSPRLDIKQNPLYESADFALLDTHYYGGIKKYQWVTIPLAIHGVVCMTDGSMVKVNVGEDPNDPDDGRIPQESAQKRGYDHNDQGKDCTEDETEIIDRDKFTCTDILLLYQRRTDAVLDKYESYVEKDRDQCECTEFFRCKQACQNQ